MTNRKQEGIPVRVSQRRLLETMDGIHKEIVEVATEHHRNSRRKPPNLFGWRNAANLSFPIYLLSPMKGVCLSSPCAKVLP